MISLPPAATEPTMYFVGVTTGKSSIMNVFPRWAEALGLDAVLRGIDLEIHAPADDYVRTVEFIKNDPLSLGALVTTHKIDLLSAARSLFDGLGEYARILGEVSAISKRDGQLWGHAKDPISSGLALEAFLPDGWWKETSGEALCFGAGGSALAISMYLMDPRHGENRPGKVVVTNRSRPRLEEMQRIHRRLDYGAAGSGGRCAAGSGGRCVPCEYHHCPTFEENDRVLASVPACSLVINATGLGKDRPGSPVTDAAVFPERGLAWDFNYRGDLKFLLQARAQEQEMSLTVEDGWIYFIHGWTQVIAEVFHVDIGPDKIDELSRIAAEVR